jgi:peptide/nickel transport system permease protein
MTGGGPAHGPELTATTTAGEAPQSVGVAGSVASTGAPTNEATPSFWAKLSKSSPLVALILQRLALSVALLFAVSLMIFGGVEALPGDFATTYLGQSATPQAIENIRKDLGLDQPATTRYFKWLGGAIQGDFGSSWASKNSVSEQIGKRLGNSLFLAFFAAIISVPLAVGLGMLAVQYRNRLPDKIINVISLAAISLPEFFVGYLLILFFAVQLGVATFPATVYESMTIGQRLSAIALPTATLVLVVLAHMMRMTRAAILNVMSVGLCRDGRTQGPRGLRHHPQARRSRTRIAPVVNVVMLNLAYLVVGVVVVESGLRLSRHGPVSWSTHVTVRDMPVVQAVRPDLRRPSTSSSTCSPILPCDHRRIPRLRHPKMRRPC